MVMSPHHLERRDTPIDEGRILPAEICGACERSGDSDMAKWMTRAARKSRRRRLTKRKIVLRGLPS